MSYGIHCCKGCTERHESCHGSCERYKEERRKMEEIKEQMRKDRELDRMDRRYWNAKFQPTSANMGGRIR